MSAAAQKSKSSNLPVSRGDDDTRALFSLGNEKPDVGRADSLRFNLLTWVLEERYDRAIQELREFDSRPSLYPNFHARTIRYIHYAIDLIYAIKAKRNFPGLTSLTRAKQYELREKYKEHLKELENTLLKVEKIETDLRIHDARSTIYVVRALWIGGLSIVALAFFFEVMSGLGFTATIVVDEILTNTTGWFFHLLGM